VVADLVGEQKSDVVMLAECEIKPAALLRTLNRDARGRAFTSRWARRSSSSRRFSRQFLLPTFDSDRVSIRRLALPGRSELILAAVHLPSKLHLSPESQNFECVKLAEKIIAVEDAAGHRRTVLVGDFNMNPFESGMVAAKGLHSVMSRRLMTTREGRTVQGDDYRFFYNPMWSHMGDARSDTAGTYFRNDADHVNYLWNMFDQVLLRPQLARRFDPGQVQIVKTVGSRSLVREDGRPDSASSSDHLPLVFELDF
jgi:endonuclease/exonuclease/phosphatase family metal-dependent hydrolase